MQSALKSALIGGALILPAGHALAQTPAQTPMEAVTVTASRLPAPLSATPDAYVVTSDQIERRGSPFAADVLAAVPGVSISENGAFGGVSSLSLRGASSDKTLVLIDGVPVNDPSAPSGGFDFSSLDLSDIDRIEVLTGPQGALWGSDAIGGVVSLTSRELDGVRAFGEGGSLETYREGGAIGHATDAYAFGVSAAYFRTEGIPKADERLVGPSHPDSFNTTTISANLRVNLLDDRVILDARGRYNAADTEYDGFGGLYGVIPSNDSSEARTASGYVRARIKDVLGFDQEVRIDLMGLDRQYHGDFPFGADGGQQVYRWSAQRQETLWGLDLGAEHKDAWENTGDGREARASNGYYAIGRLTPLKALTLTGSVRRDDPQDYRGQTTGRIAAAFDAGMGFTLKGSWSQGFKAPSIFETTYPCLECAVVGPNPNLKPERADGWDAGLAWRSPGGMITAQATYFELRTRDQIDYIYPTGYLNVARVRSTGVEAGGQVRLPYGFTLNAAYTHDDAVDGTTGARLLKIPRDSGSGSLGWQGYGFTTDLGVRSQAAEPDVYGTVKPFTLAYASGAYALTKTLEVTGRIENLTNIHYEEAFGYGEPNRTFLIGLKWKM